MIKDTFFFEWAKWLFFKCAFLRAYRSFITNGRISTRIPFCQEFNWDCRAFFRSSVSFVEAEIFAKNLRALSGAENDQLGQELNNHWGFWWGRMSHIVDV